MSFIITPLRRIAADVFVDLRSSWRFKVWAILWIPLFVTAMVGVVNLGIRNKYSIDAPSWRQQWVNEDSGINFPDVTIALQPNSLATFGSGIRCSQRGALLMPQACQGSPPPPPQTCYTFKTSVYVAALATEGQNHITCNMYVNGNAASNADFQLTVPQGYIWTANPPTYVLANRQVEVDFYRETFHTLDGRSAQEWFTNVIYQSSDFYDGSQNFNATLILRIPIRAMIHNWQYIDLDSWMLLGVWGGSIFFMWFLHGIVFGIAKLYLPNDSKVFPAPQGSAAYEAIQ